MVLKNFVEPHVQILEVVFVRQSHLQKQQQEEEEEEEEIKISPYWLYLKQKNHKHLVYHKRNDIYTGVYVCVCVCVHKLNKVCFKISDFHKPDQWHYAFQAV